MVIALAFATALSQSIVPIATASLPEGNPCSPVVQDQAGSQVFGVDDQVRLADIGQAEPNGAPRAFGMSPDGRKIAFVEKRADPRLNTYCLRLIVVAMDGRSPVIVADAGGEFIRDDVMLREFSSVAGGWDRPNAPQWSPDGTRIAYLKRVGGSTQVWMVDAGARTPAVQATEMPDNVDRFVWSDDGTGLLVETRPGIRIKAEAIAREAAKGFLFDDRFAPQFADRPIPTGKVLPEHAFVTIASGDMRDLQGGEIDLLDQEAPSQVPGRARRHAIGRSGSLAWVEPVHPDLLISPTRLVAEHDGDRRRSCSGSLCDGVREMWWTPSGASLLALKAGGWARSEISLLRWDRGDTLPRTLLTTGDVLFGCLPAQRELVCAREGSTRPRQLVAIDMKTGDERIIYDPNPEVRQRLFGSVQRLKFRNEFGTESFADLVFPPNHAKGQKHPLVVVQYNSEGFLRGGTGDEVPIHPLANLGFAVLSLDRPSFTPAALAARNEAELLELNRRGWMDRRNVQSSLETAIALALETGAIDRKRMGISGFSDGGSSVQWALINSDLFKVASLGSCCEDLYSYPTAAGPRFTDFVREMGYRHFEEGAEDFWRPMSLILNVDKVTVPILIQTGDSEYEGGLDVVETYSHRGRPIELFVLEDETHIKWQPAHRQAIYERSVDWFEFWLMKRRDCDPAKETQYHRWLGMEGAPARDDLSCRPRQGSGP